MLAPICTIGPSAPADPPEPIAIASSTALSRHPERSEGSGWY
jgi:hypothetical protein